MKGKRILIATGGTGGHIFPAIASAKLLQDSGCIISMSIDDKAYKQFSPQINSITDDLKILQLKGFSGGIWRKLCCLWQMLIGIISCVWYLRANKPDLVMSFGGFGSFPMTVGAILTGKDFIIHEQNTIMGRTNRLCTRFAKKVIYGLPPRVSQPEKPIICMPLRQQFLDNKSKKPVDKINILVLGGSQGARIFNQFMPKLFEMMPKTMFENINITEQCRAEMSKIMSECYRKLDIKAKIAPFFDNVAELMGQADIIIARSGAMTIAEISFMQKPAILIPYPHAIDDHQYYNALVLEQFGAALIINEKDIITNKVDYKALVNLISDKEKLKGMAQSYGDNKLVQNNIKDLIDDLFKQQRSSNL